MCTRVIYTPEKEQSYVARNMDWSFPPTPILWVLPNEMERNSCIESKTDPFSWKSKFSSVIVSNFDEATSDGINSEGLTANLLWLSEAKFPKATFENPKNLKPMSIGVWAQYILDICATVADAISAMNDIFILTTKITGSDKVATCHLSVGDNEGNSAIFEYINEELIIFTNVEVKSSNHKIKKYSKNQMRVMTNDPQFDKQIDSLVYWNEINKTLHNENTPAILPGSNLAVNRFVRATYYAQQLPTTNKRLTALSQLSAVLANTAQPAVIIKNKINLSKTQYTSLADQYKLQYFYRSAYSPFMIWINLKEIKFDKVKTKKDMAFKIKLNEEDGVLYLKNKEYASGNVNKHLKKATMFNFKKITV